jgi:hypothetical protein
MMDIYNGNIAKVRFHNRRKSPAQISRSDLPLAFSFRPPPRWRRTGIVAAGAFRASHSGPRSHKTTLIYLNSLKITIARPPHWVRRSPLFRFPLSGPRPHRYAKRCGRVRSRRATLIYRNSVGPAAKPSTIKTAKITLITWIWFDPVGLNVKSATVRTANITWITLIGLDPVGPTVEPSIRKSDKNALIRFDRYEFAFARPAREDTRASHLSGLRSPLSGLDTFDAYCHTT